MGGGIIYVVFWCRVEVPAGGRREMKADADIMVRTVEAGMVKGEEVEIPLMLKYVCIYNL